MSDQQLLNTLRTLAGVPQRGELPPAPERGARPGSRVTVPYTEKTSSGVGGLVSPVEEVSRTRHPEMLIWSSEGLVAFTVRRTHELVMRDAQGVEETRVFNNAD